MLHPKRIRVGGENIRQLPLILNIPDTFQFQRVHAGNNRPGLITALNRIYDDRRPAICLLTLMRLIHTVAFISKIPRTDCLLSLHPSYKAFDKKLLEKQRSGICKNIFFI